MTDVFGRLADKLDQLPNGFPRTDSGVEIKILKKIFEPDEAEIALRLNPIPETTEAIALRLGKQVAEMQGILDLMVEKGQIGYAKMFGNDLYMLVPFVVGIYEFQVDRLDREFAELFEQYAPTFMKTLGGFAPAVTRVVPVNAQIEGKHEVHRFEDVKQMFAKAKAFQVSECICRKERGLLGEPCSHSTEVCIAFSNHEGAFERYPRGRTISREEALAIAEKAEEEGLVHCTYNVQKGQMFLCNCCSCCCGLLKSVKHFNSPHILAGSNFVAAIDSDTCSACGVCADERCPMDAIVEENDGYRVKAERCIGCGVCTTTCLTGAISLVRKPDGLQDEPPSNIMDWGMKRATSRGTGIIIE